MGQRNRIFPKISSGVIEGAGSALRSSRGNPTAFNVRQKWSYAAIANFIFGLIRRFGIPR